jgi:hypothetical protein
MPVQAIVDNFDHGLSVAEISNSLKSHKTVFRLFCPTPRIIGWRILFDFDKRGAVPRRCQLIP